MLGAEVSSVESCNGPSNHIPPEAGEERRQVPRGESEGYSDEAESVVTNAAMGLSKVCMRDTRFLVEEGMQVPRGR